MTKQCSSCLVSKVLGEFPVTKRHSNGRVSYRSKCRECFNESRRTDRSSAHNLRSDNGEPDDEVTEFRDEVPKSDLYVVTYAQNSTDANKRFLKALVNYCDSNDGELVVIPGRYKNPSATRRDRKADWWDSLLEPYCFDGRLELDGITIYCDISITPTNVRPLSGMDVLARAQDGVFGHPKIQLSTVPTGRRKFPRILTTTGAVTKANYSNSKSGKKGQEHHVFGATIIEKGEKHWHIRQINAKGDGSFIDLDKRYSSSGVTKAPRPLAIICGDAHVAKMDYEVLGATMLNSDSMAEVLRPERVLYHDLLDGEVRNHHDDGKFLSKFRKHHGFQNDSVETEVRDAITLLDEVTPDYMIPVVVASNHLEFLDRWLNTSDFRGDPENAKFFVDSWSMILEKESIGKRSLPAFQMWYERLGAGRAKFLSRDEEYVLGDVDLQFHGDKGINGSRGNILAYSKLAVRTVIGHGHCAGIMDGAYQVGVMGKLDMGYNHQPSGWTHTHCILYANGKRTLITVKDGEWRRAA